MNILRNNKGQSLVETALTLPIIILLLIGIVDFGIIFNNYLVISNASREGARKAVVGIPDLEVIACVENIVSTLKKENISISVYPIQGLRESGSDVTVTIGYDNQILTPIISALIPNPIHLESKIVMRVE